MAKSQTRRRRKRYQPGSAYAGDIRPRGLFAVFGNVKLFFIIGVLIMGGRLLVGGILRSGVLGGNTTSPTNNFVEPKTTPGTGTPGDATPQIKRYTSAPQLTIDPAKHYTATIKTSAGDIQVELFAGQTPQTVNNFVFLARAGFYNGLIFHYAEPSVEVIAGDPSCQASQTALSTCRGSGDPGYQLAPETPTAPVAYQTGTIGMANASQFFIALGNSPHFGEFAPLGRITSGLDVAQKIAKGTAIESVTIQEQ